MIVETRIVTADECERQLELKCAYVVRSYTSCVEYSSAFASCFYGCQYKKFENTTPART